MKITKSRPTPSNHETTMDCFSQNVPYVRANEQEREGHIFIRGATGDVFIFNETFTLPGIAEQAQFKEDLFVLLEEDVQITINIPTKKRY